MDQETKKLMFTNLLNGVSVERLAIDFERSPSEIHGYFRAVTLKIRSYCFIRNMPFIPCESIALARQNRLALLTLLDKVNLNKAADYSRITTREVKDIADIRC